MRKSRSRNRGGKEMYEGGEKMLRGRDGSVGC